MGGKGERTPGSQGGDCTSLASASPNTALSDFWQKEKGPQKALSSLCRRPSKVAEPLSPAGLLTHYVACARGLTSPNLSPLVNKMPVK